MKKKFLLKTLLLITVLCQTFFASAFPPPSVSDINITGKVTSSDTKEALVGVSIRVDGTDKGAITDIDGNFSLTAPSDGTLILTFVGYETLKIPVNNQSVINIQLVPSASSLSELVVIGYGSTAKKDMTGAVKSLKNSEFNRGIINSPEQLLQGKMAGVNVTSASGEPGGIQSITVRWTGWCSDGQYTAFRFGRFGFGQQQHRRRDKSFKLFESARHRIN